MNNGTHLNDIFGGIVAVIGAIGLVAMIAGDEIAEVIRAFRAKR